MVIKLAEDYTLLSKKKISSFTQMCFAKDKITN